ncbi:uncharacterized protein Bfra_002265 [Botrytis fragariae]|uniref:Uncharacterized protein n=1 Tax=Botrytis fragariae TaxID=1964551 RepID=A0A8H6AYI0_9HELO|nr:uncharacterized protein Bfra_002265 [Botrytis fragariae]KAF5875869.1 hypothetical protein Bfra_002265 [Botrytis fragariae]
MHSPNSPSNQLHLNNSLLKFTDIRIDFSRPLPTPPSPSRAPPPLSYLAGHNLPVSVPEVSEEAILRASLDGNLDDIHYPAHIIPDPRSSTENPQIPHHIISSPSTKFLSHQPRITMSSPHLSRSATSPDLSAPSTISPITEEQEYTPNRNGAISRTDRYSRDLPAIPPHPSTPPPALPISTTPSSSSSNIFNSARPSNLRHVTFAHETSSLSLSSSIPSQTSSNPSSSLPIEAPRKHRFNLTLAHQKMHKAFSTLRTHTHSISPKPSLLLRKKSSHSALSISSSGSSPLSPSDASADEPTRPKTAPSSSSSFSGFANFPAMAGAFSKDAKEKRDAKAGKEMQIGAPTGMVKKTPEEIQQMLREMGVKSEDMPLISGSAASTSTPSHSRLEGHGAVDGDDTDNTPSKSQSGISKILTSYSREEKPSPVLSAVQKGKLPALPPVPQYFTRPLRSSSLSSPHSGLSVPFPVQDLTTKPRGWYSTAPLDSIRATLPKLRKEDLLKKEEIDGFLEELVRDFEVIKKVRQWRSEELDREIEGCVEKDEDEDEENEDNDEDIEGDGDEDEEPYIWGRYGEPSPDFVDGGWAQEEISSAGVGARWFVFDDVENVLGGPKCPITHAVDGFEDAEEELDVGDVGEVMGEEREIVDEEIKREEMNTTLLSPIEEGFGEGEEEEFDEDAQQLSQEEILRREGLL